MNHIRIDFLADFPESPLFPMDFVPCGDRIIFVATHGIDLERDEHAYIEISHAEIRSSDMCRILTRIKGHIVELLGPGRIGNVLFPKGWPPELREVL